MRDAHLDCEVQHAALAGTAGVRDLDGVRRGVLLVPHASTRPCGTQLTESPTHPGRFGVEPEPHLTVLPQYYICGLVRAKGFL